MTNRDLGRALLNLDVAGPSEPDPREQARRLVRRDRWVVRILAALALLLWLAAAGGVLFVVWIAVCFVFPRHQKLAQDLAAMPPEQVAVVQQANLAAWEICLEVIAASFIAMTLAALCTVWLILLARRATLREVNANLIVISEQLRLLRASSPT